MMKFLSYFYIYHLLKLIRHGLFMVLPNHWEIQEMLVMFEYSTVDLFPFTLFYLSVVVYIIVFHMARWCGLIKILHLENYESSERAQKLIS